MGAPLSGQGEGTTPNLAMPDRTTRPAVSLRIPTNIGCREEIGGWPSQPLLPPHRWWPPGCTSSSELQGQAVDDPLQALPHQDGHDTYRPPTGGFLGSLLLQAHQRSSRGFQPTPHMTASPEDIPGSPGLGSWGPAFPERPPTIHGALAPRCIQDKTQVPHGRGALCDVTQGPLSPRQPPGGEGVWRLVTVHGEGEMASQRLK